MKKTTRLLILFLALFTALLSTPTAHASPRTLSITNYNPSHGTITGPGINCGSDCSESLEAGTVVTLTATPQPGRVFVGASTLFGCPPYSQSGYSSAVTCSYTITSDEGGSFSWAYASYTVTASKEGTGSGTVMGTGTYGYGSFATLTATPSTGSVFAGWQTSGAICASGGKGGSSVNTSTTCSQRVESSTNQSLNAVARFDKASSSQPSSPPQTTTNNSSNSSSSSSNTSPASPAETAKPTSPTIEEVTVEGSTYKSTDTITIASDKPLVLSGKTVPNGKVTLYIFSEPKKYEIQADAEGKWSYTVTGLPPGEHHAEIEVTDPATNKTSERARLLGFTITDPASSLQANSDAASTNTAKKPSVWTWVAIGFITLITLLGIGFVFWKHTHPGVPLSNLNPFKKK